MKRRVTEEPRRHAKRRKKTGRTKRERGLLSDKKKGIHEWTNARLYAERKFLSLRMAGIPLEQYTGRNLGPRGYTTREVHLPVYTHTRGRSHIRSQTEDKYLYIHLDVYTSIRTPSLFVGDCHDYVCAIPVEVTCHRVFVKNKGR